MRKINKRANQVVKDGVPSLEEFIGWWKTNRNNRSKEETIQHLEKEIKGYEEKYKMPTSEFIPRYERGEFEMDDNYLDYELARWRGAYLSYKRLQDQMKREK